jgi:hypothetical protein
MKKLSLKLDDLAVDTFVATVDEKRADGTVEAYATLVGGPCTTVTAAETCPRTCRETCGFCEN